jgi:hypothetical protein
MSHHYELRLRGAVPDRLVLELDGGPRLLRQPETVVVTRSMDQRRLHNLLIRIADLGLDIRELRRLPESRPATSSPGG